MDSGKRYNGRPGGLALDDFWDWIEAAFCKAVSKKKISRDDFCRQMLASWSMRPCIYGGRKGPPSLPFRRVLWRPMIGIRLKTWWSCSGRSSKPLYRRR